VKSNRLLVALLLCLVTGTALGCGDEGEARAPSRPFGAAIPVEDIYLGVSCSEPNSVRCDQVGLYVRLRRPARRVTALVAGREARLRERAAPSIQTGTHWEAFLDDAGLDDGPLAVQANAHGRWFGVPKVRARVRLSLHFVAEPRLARTLRTVLHAGYC
jgi:hypothetical protein